MTQFVQSSVRPPSFNQASSVISKAIMTAYRWVGFSVLVAILLGLVSYIGLNVIYLVHKGWIEPVIISPTDARVLELTEQAAQQSFLRQKVEADRADLQLKVNAAQRLLDVEQAYQQGLKLSVGADATARGNELGQLAALTEHYRKAKQEIVDPTEAFSNLSKERSEQQLNAKLIDQDTMTARRREQAEMAQLQLGLREKQVDLGTRVSSLSRELSAFRELSTSFDFAPTTGKALSYDALGIAHQFHQSVLAAEGAQDVIDSAKRGFADLDKTAEHYDKLLKTLETAPLVRAATQKLTLAFIPYENLATAVPGSIVFGCQLQVLWCHRAGRVRAILDGEVIGKHPLYGWDSRGQFLEIEVEDPQAMKLPVLHLNRAPLLL